MFLIIGNQSVYMTDQQIIAEIRKGNTAVFNGIYKHFPKVRKYVMQNSGDEDDARDLFQNALLVFFKKAKEKDFELTSAIGTYIYAVCKNNWLKHITRKKEFSSEDMSAYDTTEKQTEPNAVDGLMEEMKLILVQVGDPCRSLILMLHYYKASMEEVLAEFGYANAHTARQQKYKCLLKIRKLIPVHLIEKYREING